MVAFDRAEPLANPTRSSRGVAMRRSRRVLEAYLFPAWEQWVVHVPDADDVHAIVLDRAQAEEVATGAAALVLGVDRSAIRIVLIDGTPTGRAPGGTLCPPAVPAGSAHRAPASDRPADRRGTLRRPRRRPREPIDGARPTH